MQEILTTGELREHRKLMLKVPAGLFDVLRIPGLGPKAVRSLWREGAEGFEGDFYRWKPVYSRPQPVHMRASPRVEPVRGDQ